MTLPSKRMESFKRVKMDSGCMIELRADLVIGVQPVQTGAINLRVADLVHY